VKQRVVLFGAGHYAAAVAAEIMDDGSLDLVAHTVDRDFVLASQVCRQGTLPVIPFDEVEARYPPDSNRLLVVLGYGRMNGLRQDRVQAALEKGYELASWVSRRATVWSGLDIPPNCLIFPGAIVRPYATLSIDTSIGNGSIVSHHAAIGSHTSLANGAVTGGGVRVGCRSWLGLSSVVRDGVTIAERTFVGAGAVVVADTEPDGVYVGVPARRQQGVSAIDVTA